MWQAFKNANPLVKAAIISGVFLIVATMIGGGLQLLKPTTVLFSPTPTLASTPTPNTIPTETQASENDPWFKQGQYTLPTTSSVPVSLGARQIIVFTGSTMTV